MISVSSSFGRSSSERAMVKAVGGIVRRRRKGNLSKLEAEVIGTRH